ncbi:MAG TPA: cytochrome c oxidase subunit II [Paludibacter sp.]|nr:cytochrome c oxidase subunit II [Paludibacter sp.]
MFSSASNFVNGVDSAFLIITGISVFFLVTLTATMIYFVVKYNRKKGKPAVQIKDNSLLEITWITIPMLLVLYMFYIGWEGFLPMRQAPSDAIQVTAIGSMWKYEFIYPSNKSSDTLVVPINKSVKVNLGSKDVLHGFSVPGFRIKEDMVPQKKNYSWFTAGEQGDFDIYCTVYCGVNHSYMHSIIRVVSEADYNKWLKALPVMKVDNSLGLKVLQKNGCIACHSVDGTKSVGPTFKKLYGSTIDVTTAGASRKVKVDDAYIESSITDPNKDVAAGFPQGVMKSYKGIIKDNDIKLVREYLKTLK